jgi:hypothetical protein
MIFFIIGDRRAEHVAQKQSACRHHQLSSWVAHGCLALPHPQDPNSSILKLAEFIHQRHASKTENTRKHQKTPVSLLLKRDTSTDHLLRLSIVEHGDPFEPLGKQPPTR